MTTLTLDQATADARRVIDAAGDYGLLHPGEFRITSCPLNKDGLVTHVVGPPGGLDAAAVALWSLPGITEVVTMTRVVAAYQNTDH